MTSSSILIRFVRTFILIDLVEEVIKYVGAKIVMRKEGVVHTWMDALLCFVVVGVSFQLFEDIGYASGDIILAIMRALTPFHFTFAVIMGYFYGLGKDKRNGFYTILAIVVPSFIHAVYDFSINMLKRGDEFIVLFLIASVIMFIITIVAIIKLRKWQKEGTLDILI